MIKEEIKGLIITYFREDGERNGTEKVGGDEVSERVWKGREGRRRILSSFSLVVLILFFYERE